jgi:hexulose-6-phosphate isomerase
MPTVERLALAKQYGFEGIEINLEPNTEITLESSDRDLARLLLLVKSFDLKVSGVYSRTQWYYPISSLKSEVRVAGRKIITTIISAAEILECDTVLVIPGMVDNSIFATEPEIIPYLDAYKNSVDSNHN